MKQSDFERLHEEFWGGFETLLSECKSSSDFVKRIEEEARQAFPQDYRKLCHHLAISKQRRYSAALINRLNRLVTQSHTFFYGALPRVKMQFFYYLTIGFPLILRKNSVFLWVSLALFFLPGVLMSLLCFVNEEIIYSLMSQEQVRSFEAMYDSGKEAFGRERDSETDIAMFCFYIMNNIGISFQTFASGVLFGLGSVFFLVYNGVYIGAASGHMAKVGYTDTFFPFVVGHGAFELTAIAIAGAAGLKLGWSLISPGQFTRLGSLKHAAKDAIVIVYGSTTMLLIAAFVEAFWSSSSVVPNAVKYLVGAGFWLLVIVYLSVAGRKYAA